MLRAETAATGPSGTRQLQPNEVIVGVVSSEKASRYTDHSLQQEILHHSVEIGNPSRRRPLVPSNDFVFQSASAQEVDAYLRFDPPSRSELRAHFQRNSRVLQPMWTCHSNHNRSTNKLVYLQMVRSGTTMIRALLKAYAQVCHAGLAMVTECLDLGWPSLVVNDDDKKNNDTSNTSWVNSAVGSPHYMSECQLTALEERNGTSHDFDFNESNPVSTHLLQEHGVDILAGFLPLGSAARWKQTPPTQHDDDNNDKSTRPESSSMVDARYVVFLRDPLSRFVSQWLMPPWTANGTISTVLSNIHRAVTLRRTRPRPRYHRHEKISNILITPEQRYWAEQENVEWTWERQVNVSKANLIHHNVLVGILERTKESLALLQYVMDGEYKLSAAFSLFASSSSSSASDKIPIFHEMKQTRERTRQVVQAIRSNATMHALMDDYLRYEYEIYNFALQVNEVQCSMILQRNINGNMQGVIPTNSVN
ncbi:hypothetical protein ACA910_005611 [Epithemia clementina (nom. ined.)]